MRIDFEWRYLQVLEKNNKKLKGTSTLLGTRRLNFDRARSFWQAQRGAWLAIDFEAWDREHSVLLEFGYSSVQWHDGQKIEDKGHLIVKEHKKYFNTYVPNFREVRVLYRYDELGILHKRIWVL